ncbi:ZmpA/ZmpB/ZmpC family metallo-endopeptidase [Streptococcus plurextorum]|uniref:ZmpA/ZmpB/ZmpC family metallo-endopeptidase n=1 Tax=Streptococcus plurextorum TaxID=456876 RepID=UPI00041BA5C8|nr:ZmpA/ZmpB/ZmpC family metallo-endopeptidase [Streptococcus plurextorum]
MPMKNEQRSIFSIRKLTVGVVSLCIGLGLFSLNSSCSLVEASERIARVDQEVHFQYVLEEELTEEEKSRIVQALPEQLRQEATYFLVYRPRVSKALPTTGDKFSSAPLWFAAGFLVIAVTAFGSKKARIYGLFCLMIGGSVLSVFEVEAITGQALAAYNQTKRLKAGDSLPDGKLQLVDYDFVGYILEEGQFTKEIRPKSEEQGPEVETLEPSAESFGSDSRDLLSTGLENEAIAPERRYREERLPLPLEQMVVEDAQLPSGQERIEAGVAGTRINRYEEIWLDGRLLSSQLIETMEEAGKPEIIYRGTKVELSEEQPFLTELPTTAPQILPPTQLEFSLAERVDRQPLAIPEEMIETDRLAQGEREIVEGQEGWLEITYQDVVVSGQVVASNEISRQETPPVSRKIYVGTRVDSATEDLSQTEPLEVQVPTTAPQSLPPVQLEFSLAERVDRQSLAIPEEMIETDRLAQGEREVVEGQEGWLDITYQDVVVSGQVVASNEISRQETPPVSRKIYVGTRVDSKVVAPLTHHLPDATLITEEVSIPYVHQEATDPDLSQGESRVVPGQVGLQRLTYAELDGIRTLIATEEVRAPQAQITYRGTRVVEESIEEELPLVERIIEHEDQYEDYLWVEQTGRPGRRRKIYQNGQFIREEELDAGQERIVHKGTKPIQGSLVDRVREELAYQLIFQADSELDYGIREESGGQLGEEIYEVTYRTVKGQIAEELDRRLLSRTAAVDKVIRVGTKPTEEIETEALAPVYQADENLVLNQQVPLSPGRERVRVYRTTYHLDQATGQLTSQRDQGQVRDPGQAPIVRVGTQATIELVRESLPMVYQADSSRPISSPHLHQAGRDKVTRLTTTYSLNEQTGETSPLVTTSQVIDVGQAGQILVGAAPSVRQESLDLPTIYRERADEEPPYRVELTPARPKRTDYVTTYQVDAQTGQLIPQAETSILVDSGQSAVYEVGIKAKVERQVLPHRIIREDDESLPIGEEEIGPVGSDGSITRTTPYRLDQVTGLVETLPTIEEVIPAQDQLIRVGTKVREVPPQALEKPNVSLDSQRTEGALVIDEEHSLVELYYRVADPDRTLLGLRLEIYHNDQLVKTIDHTHQGLDTDKIQVTGLEHYVPYQARLSFRYQSPEGEREEEVVSSLPFELSPKAIELNRVSQRDLFYRNQQGELKQVTGLFQEPADLTGYFVRYQTRDAKEFLWEVQSIQDGGDQFEVSVSLPKLVQARNQSDANQLEALDRFSIPKIQLAEGTYADFDQLIEAMRENPEGSFKLAADLVASPKSTGAYVENFSGRLEGLDGKTFRILQLTKPLFQNMTGAQIEHIRLDDVALEGENSPTAALAVTATNSQIRDVHVTGRVQSYAGAAGLVYDANASQFESVSFKGQMDLSDHHTSSQITSGGLIGYLRLGSSLRKAYVDLTAQFGPRLSMQDRFGAVVGNAVLSTIDSVFVDGQVEKTTSGGTLAGIGTGGYGVGISNLASALALPEEGFYSGLWTSLPFQLILQEGQATGRTGDNLQISWKSAEEIQQFLRERGLDLLVNPPQSAGSAENLAPSSQPDFHLLRNGREERKLAYENMSKLLPFYDRHTIVRLGNQLADDSLFVTKSIQSILALKDREVVSDFSDRPDQVNKLLVHFADQDVQIFDLTYQGAFDQTGVLEYGFGDNLLFTPYQWVTGATSSSLLSTLRSSFEGLDVESEDYAQKTRMDDYLQELRFTRGNPNLVISMKQLYLKHSQQQLKDQLDKELRSLIASQWVTSQPSAAIEGYIQEEIEKHKESIWLAWTYLARYYAIDYDRLNTRNLATYHPNFYGQNLSTLDWLKQVGELTYKDLAPFRAPQTFESLFEKQLAQPSNLFDYLELNRRLFSPTQTDAAWFKQSSKAFIHEEASPSRPDQSVQVYDQLKGHSDYHRYVLPLLNLPEEDQIYLVSLANVLVFGSYGRYVDHQLQKTQATAYQAKVKEIQEQAIPKHARIWNSYMEFIKSLVSPEARQSIESKLITVREGYNIKDAAGKPLRGDEADHRRWASEFGDSYRPIDDFFGPTELYYGSFEMSGAADFEFKKYIIYGNADLLTPTGNSTFTHEMTHILEDELMNLAGRRQGQESESYALGLLQSIASSNAYYYGFNLTEELDSRASHNSSPSRLTSKEDLRDYLKGSFDTTYFLDALEAEELLKLPKAQQQTVLRKIELELGTAYSQNGQTYRDAHDKIRNLSPEEWQNIQLTKVEDLVTHNLQLANTINNVGTYLRDNDKNYYFVPLYYPIYAGLLNDQGTVGGLQFRRTALELLAEKGWDQGFLPYVSNQLAQEAQANGRALTDSYIWEKMMPDYQDYASFKKARYQTSLSQKNAMKPIQIHWNGRQYDLQNGQAIQDLMRAAIAADVANPTSSFQRQQLKEVLYKAFHESSQEFRESIFQAQPSQPTARSLEPRFELKSVEGAELFYLENATARPILALTEKPADLTNYVAKFTSDQHQAVYLPVSDIVEVQEAGQTYFKVLTSWGRQASSLRSSQQSVAPSFLLAKTGSPSTSQGISSFQDLLTQIGQNSNGNFVLANDLYVPAGEVATSTYIPHTFTGQLDGRGYRIYGLQAPLFKTVAGRVANLHLEQVAIQRPTASNLGSLAETIRNGQVENVHITGDLRASHNLGGLAGEVYDRSRLSNVSFTGTITSSYTGSQNNFVGGLVGWLATSQLEKARVSADISAYSASLRAGGLVGQAERTGTSIGQAYAEGAIYTVRASDAEAGGLIGSVPDGGSVSLRDALTAVQVFNGKQVYGFATDSSLAVERVAALAGQASGREQAGIASLQSGDLPARLQALGLHAPTSNQPSGAIINRRQVDYLALPDARPERLQAYKNVARLLPLLVSDLIISHANSLDAEDDLVRKVLVSVLPMVDQQFVYDTSQQANAINRLALHFADHSLTYHDLEKVQEFPDLALVEYRLLDKGISYTSHQAVEGSVLEQIVTAVLPQLQELDWYSPAVRQALGLSQWAPRQNLDQLQLRDSFEAIKANLGQDLRDLLATSGLSYQVSPAYQTYLTNYLIQNKAEVMLGLAYLNKWYALQFGQTAVRDLLVKKGDFFGRPVDSLQQVIEIGRLGQAFLKPKQNALVAKKVLGETRIGGDLFTLLDAYRKTFLPTTTTNDWFKQASKARIIETYSRIEEVRAKQTQSPTGVYHNTLFEKMADPNWTYKELALLLLHLPKKELFLLTDMTNTVIGSYDRYADPEQLDKELEQIAQQWAGHADFWYSILPAAHKDKMFKRVMTWDSRYFGNDWADSKDSHLSVVRHFYAPMELDYEIQPASNAYSDLTDIYFMRADIRGMEGARVYSHEMVHVSDDDTYLLGHGRRAGMGLESFAQGLFQSNTWLTQENLSLNTIMDYTAYAAQSPGKLLTNSSPSRFNSPEDVQVYMRNYMDVFYSLDYLEAEAVLQLSNPEAKANWFNRMVTLDNNHTQIQQTASSIQTFNDLLEQGLVSRRSYDPWSGTTANEFHNAYLDVNALNPLFAATGNNGTSRNEYEFRKIAFELLAEKGYEAGFVPYVSNQYGQQLTGSSTKPMADSQLLALITENQYGNILEFRKAMFERRIQGLGNLKPVQLIGKQEGGYFHGQSQTVSSIDEIRRLMAAAVAYDASNRYYSSQTPGYSPEKSAVYSLKAALLNAYLRETKEFRESIYRN